MAKRNTVKGGGRLPPSFVDKGSDGNPDRKYNVNQVNAENRTDVDIHSPQLLIGLYSEDLSQQYYTVYIPRTREMPDVVLYKGVQYYAYDTAENPPQYARALVATAMSTGETT